MHADDFAGDVHAPLSSPYTADREQASPWAAKPLWTLSVVSHGHLESIRRLLADLAALPQAGRFEIILTINDNASPAAVTAATSTWPGKNLRIIRNSAPRGFGANHNAALRMGSGDFLAVIDPDLSIDIDPFSELADALTATADVGLAAPTVVAPEGSAEDNARPVVTPFRLFRRHALRRTGGVRCEEGNRPVDWIAGLFMAMHRDRFHQLGGFDERYFMYCEDVDLSLRAWNSGLKVLLVATPPVTHRAQRSSQRRPRHLAWHVESLGRLWTSPTFARFVALRALHASTKALKKR